MTFGEEFAQVPQENKTQAPGGFQEDLEAPQWVRRIVPKRESVELSKLSDQLDEVQKQVDKILQSRASPHVSPGKMRLTSLEVSLGITASGGIGVVTAGIQASLTLVYEAR